MSRTKIVLLLYVLTFLMSAYIKFTRPEKFETNLEIFREVDIIDPSNHALKYKWYSEQNKAQFVYNVYKQIGDSLRARNFSQPGLHKIVFDRMHMTWEEVVDQTTLNNSQVELSFKGNLANYRILVLKSNEYSIAQKPQKRVLKYSNKDFNNILVFRKVPFKNEPIVINFEQVGYDSENKFMFDKFSLNLVDSSFSVFKQTYNSINPTFEMDYNLSSKVVDIKGNYIETIEEKINLTTERLVYYSKVFNIQAQGPQSFQITYPPDNFKEETRIPVGIPYKQTIIANQPIDKFILKIGDREYPEIDIRTEPEDEIRQSGLLKYKCHDNKKTIDLFFPIFGGGNEAAVNFTATSGIEVTNKSWPINIMGLQFSSWPPIKPKKWTDPEQQLYSSFLARFPNQGAYERASIQERSRYPLVFESRDIIVLPHFQNVDFETYQNYMLAFPEKPGSNIVRRENAMRKEIEALPRDISQLTLTVNTDFGKENMVFFVKKVLQQNQENYIKRFNVVNSGKGGDYSIYIECVNYFDEIIKIDADNLKTDMNLYFEEVSHNLFKTHTKVSNSKLKVFFNLDYFGRDSRDYELRFKL